MTTIPNIHPADELAAIREEIKQLQEREGALRAHFLKEGADMDGKQYAVTVTQSKTERVDKEALVSEFGREMLAPFLKVTTSQTVRVTRKAQALE